jgi:proline/betaine transport protein TphA
MSFKKTTVIAGLFGNALEWYDFILYANFAPLIAKLFFPAHDPLTSLLLTFVVFASGFLVRPIGAIIFGHIGDKLGRRTALITSIGVITIPTFLIGCIPTYASAGLMAPVILTMLRLFQGIAVSGELNSAATFLVEYAPDNRRGLAGCLVMGTAFLGILIGAIVASLTTETLTTDVLHAWGWRVPFWFGGLLGLVGLYIRLRIKESPKFLEEVATKENRAPLKHLFLNFRKELFLTIVLTSIMAVGNYIFIAYVVTFLVKFQGFSLKDASLINLISMFVMVLLFPVMGILSDKIGRKPVFRAGLFGFMIFSIPIFWLLSQKHFAYALAGDLLLCVVLVPIAALIPTLIAELFPTSVRNSGTALGYNICLAIFGGTAPLVAIELTHATGSTLAPANYLIFCAILAFGALCFISENYHKPLA